MIDQSQFSITKFFKCLQWYCIVNVGGRSPNVRCQDRLAGAQSAWERKEPCQQTSCGHISENNPSSAWHEHCHLVISIIDGGDTFELHPVAATEVVPEFFGRIFLSDPSPIIGNACYSLTHWLTHSLPFSKLDWCDPGVWRCQLKTCWGCYYCWCWC